MKLKSYFRGATVPVSFALLAFLGVSWCNWRGSNRLHLFYAKPSIELIAFDNIDSRRDLPESREVRIIRSDSRERVPINFQRVANFLAPQQFNASGHQCTPSVGGCIAAINGVTATSSQARIESLINLIASGMSTCGSSSCICSIVPPTIASAA